MEFHTGQLKVKNKTEVQGYRAKNEFLTKFPFREIIQNKKVINLGVEIFCPCMYKVVTMCKLVHFEIF